MRFEITACGPLRGDATLPGDCRLTLSVMALAVLCSHPVTIINPSPDPEVGLFKDYLKAADAAAFSDSPDGFIIAGMGWKRDIAIDDGVPVSVAHIVAAGAVFSGRNVVLKAEHETETTFVTNIVERFRILGVRNDLITQSDGFITVGGSPFPASGEFHAASSWSFEAIAAGAMAAKVPVSISYISQSVSHSIALFSLLGFGGDSPESEDREAELTRRMARLSVEPVPVVKRFSALDVAPPPISIPGDTLIASALAAAASIVQKSDIRIRNVLFEPGRRGFFDCLRRMKGSVVFGQTKHRHTFDTADIDVAWGTLEGIHVTAGQAQTFVQELPVLGALCAFAQGESVISDSEDGPGAGREAFVALADSLEMLGAHVGDFTDGIVVRGGRELRGNLVDSNGDPAVALACAIAGLNSAGTTVIFGFDEDSWPISAFLASCGALKT